MLPSLLEFVGGAVLVGHNLRFDLSFIDHALVSTDRERLANATVDTLALARRLVRDLVPDCKLGTLAAHLWLPHRPSHRALADVLATGDLLHALLERAGPFGILGLEELLDLPRLVGHPHAAKLRLTTRLPHTPGVYWFTDAAGHVLYVDKAADIRKGVRSSFAAGKRPRVDRLLGQLHSVHHRSCPGPLTAAVLEGRLLGAWSPPFNRQGNRQGNRRANPQRNRRRRDPGTASGGAERQAAGGATRGRRGRRAPGVEDLDANPSALLAPFGDRLAELSRQERFEEAAAVRDEAEGLRHLLAQRRQVEALRGAGRMVLSIDGEGTVTLDGGLLVGSAVTPGSEPVPVPHPGRAGDGGDGHAERIIVAQWLMANAERVRILEVESHQGMAMPAVRIPRLAELHRGHDHPGSADPGPPRGADRASEAGPPGHVHSAA
jgi:hypothetical protein